MSLRASRRLLATVAIVAALVRLGASWPRVGGVADDPDNYLPLAESLQNGLGYRMAASKPPTAYRPPLYPLLLAPLVRPWRGGPSIYPWTDHIFTPSMALLHALIGGATAATTSVAARRWGLEGWKVAAAGLIVAFDPLLVAQSRSVMTETLAALLLAWAIAEAAPGGRGGVWRCGLAFGVAALCRPSTLSAAALTLPFAAWPSREGWRDAILRGVLFLTPIVAVLAPWAIRNKMALGEFVWTTTHGGYTLALANNDDYYRDVLDGPPGAVWSARQQAEWGLRISRKTSGLGEPEADRRLAREGWRMLRDRPRDFLRASLARIGRFWALAPSSAVYGPATRLASFAWSAPLLALAALGLARGESWRWPRAVAPATLLGLSLVHCVYWTDMRMRAPLIPALAILAISALPGPGKKSRENPES